MTEETGGRAVNRGGWLWAVLLPLLLTARPPVVAAQQQPEPAPALYRYGKWTAALLAAGATAAAINTHNTANRDFQRLVDYCATRLCNLQSDGHYADAGAEARYQVVVNGDRAARAWFVGAQAALAGAVALFILEIRHGPGEPSNIPYSGLLLAPGRVGLRVSF